MGNTDDNVFQRVPFIPGINNGFLACFFFSSSAMTYLLIISTVRLFQKLVTLDIVMEETINDKLFFSSFKIGQIFIQFCVFKVT